MIILATVDGSEVGRSPVEGKVVYPIIYQGFQKHPTQEVFVSRISEPSTVIFVAPWMVAMISTFHSPEADKKDFQR